MPPESAFNDPEAVKRILAEDAICDEVFIGESCIFPDMPTPNQYPDVVQLDKTSTAFAVLVSGQIVAACESVRENDACAEAYVYTAPGFRRRGYGAQVTAAWAHHLMVQGKVPFYSYAR
ncbi:GNAT family N-acetyltransferase [Candidatus Poribacteria bacterium]|nr:GNAT family N-acetyltransferase [Candidatus Poribacteria bacterium]